LLFIDFSYQVANNLTWCLFTRSARALKLKPTPSSPLSNPH